MPLQYLLDTNVVSETRKRRPETGVLNFFEQAHSSSLYLSVLTLVEVRKGIASLISIDPDAAIRLASWLDGLEYSFADRILPVDGTTARIWGELAGQRPRPVIDTLIAATAIQHDLTMVTRDTTHFAGTALKLLDPWGSA